MEAITESSSESSEKNALEGWKNWITPEVEKILVKKGETLTVRLYIKTDAAGWGTIDDLRVSGPHGVIIEEPDEPENPTEPEDPTEPEVPDDSSGYGPGDDHSGNGSGSSFSSTGIASDYVPARQLVPIRENVVNGMTGSYKMTISGVYQAGTIVGAVIIGNVSDVKREAGLTQQDVEAGVQLKYYICDTTNKTMKESLRKQAVSDGYQVGTIVNLDLYRIYQGTVENIRYIPGSLEMKIGVPGYLYKTGRKFSLMAIDADGKVILIKDKDTDDKTITVDMNYFGIYAIIYE